MKTSDYKNLVVWQKAMTLCNDVYVLTKAFPKEELFGITNQMRRCAVSIPSNIAEGQARHTPKEFIHFLKISYGSLAELETQLLISLNIGLTNEETIKTLLENLQEIQRMVMGLVRSIEKDS